MNSEFKRMMQLAGLNEISINPPERPLAVGQRYNMKTWGFFDEETTPIEITNLSTSPSGERTINIKLLKYPDSEVFPKTITKKQWDVAIKYEAIVPL